MNINKFGQLISYITVWSGKYMEMYEVEAVGNLVTNLIEPNKVACDTVDSLLKAIGVEGQKIEAIKHYRVLTGADLRTSKDAVERYWSKGTTNVQA